MTLKSGKNEKIIKHLLLNEGIFLIFCWASETVLRSLEIFRVLAELSYLWTYWLPLILAYKQKYLIAIALTLGNVFGVIIGQFLGDLILVYEEMYCDIDPKIFYGTMYHSGVFFWMVTVTFFGFTAYFVDRWIKKKGIRSENRWLQFFLEP